MSTLAACDVAAVAVGVADDVKLRECRICLVSGNYSDLISPCECKGSSKWVHRSCLDEWRSRPSLDNKNFTHCGVCHFKYEIVQNNEEEKEKQKRVCRWGWLLIRDIFLALLLTYLALLVLVGIFWGIDVLANKKLTDVIATQLAINSPAAVYHVYALMVAGFITGVVGICYICRHERFSAILCPVSGVEPEMIILVVIFIIFAGLGLGVIGFIMWVIDLAEQHSLRIWNRQLAQKFQVRDLSL
jgi:hypothetical protein